MLIEQQFHAGQSIVNQNDPAPSFYIIKKGSVKIVNQEGKEVATLEEKASFGEGALMSSSSLR